jgi:hypothetical protein
MKIIPKLLVQRAAAGKTWAGNAAVGLRTEWGFDNNKPPATNKRVTSPIAHLALLPPCFGKTSEGASLLFSTTGVSMLFKLSQSATVRAL